MKNHVSAHDPSSGAWGLLLISLLMLGSCATKTTPETTAVTDSVVTASVVTGTSQVSEADSTTYSEQSDAEDVYGEVGDDFQGDYQEPMEQEGDGLSRQDEDGIVHFVTSRDYDSQTFPVSLFNENDNAVDDVPAFLNAKGIQYNLEKTDADPNYDESTDVYVYTFGESVIEISYGDVNSAVIHSPEIELKDGVKVGMTKDEFMAVFPQVQAYSGADEFRLHPYPFAAFCYMTFFFEDGKISSIKLEIGVQDCG